jgi:hypothetical protein
MKCISCAESFSIFDIHRIGRAISRDPNLNEKECLVGIDEYAVRSNIEVAKNLSSNKDICFVVKSD